ncbi:class I SAM-dependent methyltransferase [Stenotrophomonas rhizophila]|uniref:Cyclopropane fatty-acyl-phospholipid synthase-like methyltransferase n=1 Tax=Stenotrophomonas rhizophila TaxID=216778 RepID=A0AAW5PIF9_9GAMM|nr:class I SAM-dependent methyltransferase [Stenotrophomonas rhizophila]MCS4279924.1 cyclopropane fatty-acyl-phospholipid synthase-like methyltransferase [Stenotrophomonas rhizophila]
MSEMRWSEACERNRAPILAVLQRHLAPRERVLEIGSGTGQHAEHFARALPHLQWQASDHPDHLPGIAARLQAAGLPNTPAPWPLQAVLSPTPGLGPLPAAPLAFDAVFSANTLHIMSWAHVQALFAGLPAVMAADALLCVYGPFNEQGTSSSESNRQFDGWLKARDPASGIRDADAVDALAAGVGLVLIEDAAMPANNRLRVWRRTG